MGVVPAKYRDAIRGELDALVDGRHPEMGTWVTAYPARLVRQPDLIWSHAQSEVIERGHEGMHGARQIRTSSRRWLTATDWPTSG